MMRLRVSSLYVGHILLQYAISGVATAEFAKSLLPWVSQALPVRRVPLTALTTFVKTCARIRDGNYEAYFYDFGDAAEALRTLGSIAEALTAAAPDELPSVVMDDVVSLATTLYEKNLPPREEAHVTESLRYLFALRPRLRVACRDRLRVNHDVEGRLRFDLALRLICSNHDDVKARARVQKDVERAARSNRRRWRFRVEIISAYSCCCEAAGTADLVRLLDDEDDDVRGAAAIALVQFVIRNGIQNLDAATRGLILLELRGRRLVSLAAFSLDYLWRGENCGDDEVNVEFMLQVALVFATDHDERVWEEGEELIKRSLNYLSPPIVDAIFELAESPREEVRERACRLLSQCLGPSCDYFDERPAGRDLAFRCVEPLLNDESFAVCFAAAQTVCACITFHYILGTGADERLSAQKVPRYLAAIADFMLHEPVEDVRERIGDFIILSNGIVSVLNLLYPRQPTLDAFVVKRRRKRRRRSKPAQTNAPRVIT